ncbi:MAG: hypothetical protein GX556_13665 [Fibrobacter sp.]|nr:hypothetical protein [Fibrobacter sp.]
MNCIKAFLAVLNVASFCVANISGIVTDTGTTPIPHAIVLLEKSGQMATTGADGSFTISTSAVILDNNAKRLQNSLSPKICGNLLILSIAKRSTVKVTAFNLKGKSISFLIKTIEPGNHTLPLPQRGAGVFLYKVKTDNSTFLLKGTTVSNIPYRKSLATQDKSSIPLAKQMQSKTVINDVIAATKSGYLTYRVVIGNSDTSGIEIKMIVNAGDVMDQDGNVYQSVRIGNQVWTVENLRTTRLNNGEEIPHVANSNSWADLTTPGYCYYKNSINANDQQKWGALYNWYAVNTGNLAPEGWHVPTDEDWTELEKFCISNRYNWDGNTSSNKIGKSLAATTDWISSDTLGGVGNDMQLNNRTGLSGLPSGYRYDGGAFLGQNYHVNWWSTTEIDVADAWCCGLNFQRENLLRSNTYKKYGLPVRLLMD